MHPAAMPGIAAASSSPPPPPPPPGPPVTLANADVSAVPEAMRPVVDSLTDLYYDFYNDNDTQPREAEDTSKRIGALFWKLNRGEVSQGVCEKLRHLCQALDAGDSETATRLRIALTVRDWDECGHWLIALRRLMPGQKKSWAHSKKW